MNTQPFRPTEPMPPDLRYNERPDACAVTMTFNGNTYWAMLHLDGGGKAQPEEVATMLIGLADEIRRAR